MSHQRDSGTLASGEGSRSPCRGHEVSRSDLYPVLIVRLGGLQHD